MQLSNVIIVGDKLLLDPVLAEFVNKFALSSPSFVLTNKGLPTHFNSSRSIDGKHVLDDEREYVQRLDVRHKETNEYLGRVGVIRKYHRRRDNTYVFFVDSWRITNQRGDRNTTYSSKLDSIMRTAKRNLMPKGFDEVMANAVEEISMSATRAISNLMSRITQSQCLPSGASTLMQLYIFSQLTGQKPPSACDKLIEDMKTDRYRKAMEEYRLAVVMRNLDEKNYLRAVVAHNGGYLYSLRGTEALLFHTFDELPEWMQNQLGVLQLMEDRELVNNVGYRLNDTHFAVIQPE